jgi:hypothetical protein
VTEQPLEDDTPVDPDAHLYDDSEEGADESGAPVLSVHGSEELNAVPDAPTE